MHKKSPPKKSPPKKRSRPAILSSSDDEDHIEPQQHSREAVSSDSGSSASPRHHGQPEPPPAARVPNVVRGNGRAPRGNGSRFTGPPRMRQFTEDQEEQIIDFYRENPCLFDKQDPNYRDTASKSNILREFAATVGLETIDIVTWYNKQRRYYTQNVQKSSTSSGSAAKAPTEQYDFVSRNFAFLEGHTKPITQRCTMGSGVRTIGVPSPDHGDSDCTEDTQDSQGSTIAESAEPAASKKRQGKRLEDSLMETMSSMTDTGKQLAASLLTPPQAQPTVNTNRDDEDEIGFINQIGRMIKSWSSKDKRTLAGIYFKAYDDLASAIENRPSLAPSAAIHQHHQYQQPGPSGFNPHYQQSLTVSSPLNTSLERDLDGLVPEIPTDSTPDHTDLQPSVNE